ncbi:MAG: NAD(P)-dependent oxidoreductase [Proteobacteria bacterium]|nr:NAD(P)-dependent oxidoreductase [Pseudomonadota bacterium]
MGDARSCRSDCKRIGFIGLGLMGAPMAMNLLKAGQILHCYDLMSDRLTPLQRAGAIIASDIAEIMEITDVTILSLPNLRSVQEVTETMLQNTRAGHVIINTSTVTTSLSKKLDSSCKEKGVTYFDSPVSGGVKGAELGTLTFIVGGDKEQYEQIKPILSYMGRDIFYVGAIGVASIIKLINQLLFFTGVLSVCEAVYLANKADMDKKTVFEVVARGSGNSYALQTRLNDFILADNYEPGCSVNLALKDIELLLAEAANLGIELPGVSMVKKRLLAAKILGISEKEISLIASYFEDVVKQNP